MASRALILLACLLLAPVSMAAIEVYDFQSEQERQRFQSLGGILRCPMCENQSVIDSDSPSAFDMRQELYALLQQGYDDTQVLDYMKARFGDYIVYRPPLRSDTWLLWYLPPLLLAGALLLLVLLARLRSRVPSAAQAPLTDAARQQQLDALLALDQDTSSTSSDSNKGVS